MFDVHHCFYRDFYVIVITAKKNDAFEHLLWFNMIGIGFLLVRLNIIDCIGSKKNGLNWSLPCDVWILNSIETILSVVQLQFS